MAWKPRFSIRMLLLLVAVVAVGSWYAVSYQLFRQADQAYHHAVIAHENGLATFEEVCQASAELRDARMRLPLADAEIAGQQHLLRVLSWQMRFERGCFLSGEGPDPLHAMFENQRLAGEAWLERYRQ